MTSYQFISIDYPGAQTTEALGINGSGQVVGFFTDQAGNEHGFLYSNGVFSTIDGPPDSVAPGSVAETRAYGINDSGQIVGSYIYAFPPYSPMNGGFGESGFLYAAGTISPVNYPGALETFPVGVSNGGEIAGAYENDDVSPLGDSQGFIDSGGTYSTIDVAGATNTAVQGISGNGQIVGYSVAYGGNGPPSPRVSNFIYRNGNFNTLKLSGTPSGINSSGQIVGFSNPPETGLLLSGGSLSTISYPGAQKTFAFGINDTGQIVGAYEDQQSTTHGFLGTPKSQ